MGSVDSYVILEALYPLVLEVVFPHTPHIPCMGPTTGQFQSSSDYIITPKGVGISWRDSLALFSLVVTPFQVNFNQPGLARDWHLSVPRIKPICIREFPPAGA